MRGDAPLRLICGPLTDAPAARSNAGRPAPAWHSLGHLPPLRCPECGRKRCCRLRCRNVFQCTRCRHQVSLTAGTVFANTKLPLRRWFLAMYLLTQSKNGLSAMPWGVSWESATTRPGRKHKRQVMLERDESGRLGQSDAQVDAYLGGDPRKTRYEGRRQDAPSPRAGHRKDAGLARMSCVKGFRKQEIAAWAHRHLRIGLLGRTTSGEWRKQVVSTARGNRRGTACEAPGLGWVNTVLGNVKRALDGTYHAWGQKYAPQRYLAEFSYRFNRPTRDLVPRLARCRCADSSVALSPVNCGWHLCVIGFFMNIDAQDKQDEGLLRGELTPAMIRCGLADAQDYKPAVS